MSKFFLRSITVVLFGVSLTATGTPGQTPEEMATSQSAEQAARKALSENALADYLKHMLTAEAARPNHSRLIYNLAAAYALNGASEKALDGIKRLADMGLVIEIDREPRFMTLSENLRFKALRAQFATNARPVNAARRAFTIEDKTLIAESLAYDPKTETFYVGSVHKGKIVAIDRNGVTTDLSAPSDGLWSVLGMRVDAKRRILWVCSTAFPQMKGYTTSDKGRAGVFKYDLSTGKLLKTFILPSGEDHALGDLIISENGDVYITDSISPVIYKIAANSSSIEEYLRSKAFSSLQGLAFDRSGKDLFVADYSKGIFRVNMETKGIVQLKPSANVTALGIDGIYQYEGSLIAVQNGVNPNRIVRLSISNDKILASETLEANHPDFEEPTLGVLDGEILYFVANSQWNKVNEKAELAHDKLRPTVVLKLSLRK